MELLSLSMTRRFRPALLALGAVLISTQLFAQPTARSNGGMIFDEQQRGMILFGGQSGPAVVGNASNVRSSLNDTWLWTGQRWVRLYPDVSPSPRSGFLFEFDDERQQGVLFGGFHKDTVENKDVVNNETWIYTPSKWTQLQPANSPSARRFPGGVWDPVTKRVLLFGGVDGETIYHDTWAFDGTNWTQILADGPEVTGPSLVFDKASNSILMIGATKDGKDTVMHRLTATGWQSLTPTKLPTCGRLGAMVYQDHNNKVMQFGGLCWNGTSSSETLEWDGSNWVKIDITITPGAAYGHGMEYDPIRRETLLFGGADIFERALTYRYRDAKWSFSYTNFSPGPRSLFGFEHNPVTGETLLYGGMNDQQMMGDLWSYGLGGWRRQSVEGGTAGCSSPLTSWDSSRNVMVTLCEESDTYELDGATMKWKSFGTLKDKPPVHRFASMVYDPRLKKTVFFGGWDGSNYLKQTWLWDGTKWTRAAKENAPPPRMLGVMFYDPKKERVTLFGGIGRPTRDDRIVRYGDMWSFDGTAWTQLTPTKLPAARYGASSLYDPLREKVIMFGGKSEEEKFLDELWEWDGTTWTQNDQPTRPSARMNGRFAWDSSHQRLLYFGGYGGYYFGDMYSVTPQGWTLIPDAYGRPRTTSRPATSGGAMEPRGTR